MRNTIAFVAALGASVAANAAPTDTLYVGFLSEAGTPVDGTVNLNFAFENASGDREDLDFDGVLVTGGEFVLDVPLGGVYDSLGFAALEVEVTVEGDTLERFTLGVGAYALSAAGAEHALVADDADDVGEGGDEFGPLVRLSDLPSLTVPASALTNVPAGFLDGDQGTAFTVGSGLVLSGGQLRIADGAVTNARLADDSLVAANFASGSVNGSHVIDGSLAVATGAVTTDKVANGTLNASRVAGSSVSVYSVTAVGCEGFGNLSASSTCPRSRAFCPAGQARNCTGGVCSTTAGGNSCNNTFLGVVKP